MSNTKPLTSLLPKGWNSRRSWEVVFISPDVDMLYDPTAEQLAQSPSYRFACSKLANPDFLSLTESISASEVTLETLEINARLGVVFWYNDKRIIIAINPSLTQFSCVSPLGQFTGKITGHLPKWLYGFCKYHFQKTPI